MPNLSLSAAGSCTGSGGEITASASSINSGYDITITITGDNTATTQSETLIGGAGSASFTGLPDDFYVVSAVEQTSGNTAPEKYVTINCPIAPPPPPPPCELYVGDPDVSGVNLTLEAETDFPPLLYSLNGSTFAAWPGSLSGLAFGNYEIVIQDANGCTELRSFEIAPPDASDLPDGFQPEEVGEIYRFFLKINGVNNEIFQPQKFESLDFILKRDTALHGFFGLHFTELKLGFDCAAGLELIREQYQKDGNDARVIFRAFRLTRGCSYREIYFGSVDFNNYSDLGDEIQANVKKITFDDKLRTRRKTKVDIFKNLDLDDFPIAEIRSTAALLHSQGTTEEYNAGVATFQAADAEDDFFISSGTNTVYRETVKYLQFDFDLETLSEIGTVYHYPTDFNHTEPAENYKADFAGLHRFSGTIKARLRLSSRNDRSGAFGTDVRLANCTRGIGGVSRLEIALIYKINGAETRFFEKVVSDDCGLWNMETGEISIPFSREVYLNAGEKFSVFGYFKGSGDYVERLTENSRLIIGFQADVLEGTSLNVAAVTFAPASTARGLFIHDAAAKLLAILTGKNNIFRSSYYGRAADGYFSDGCGADRVLLSGEAIRQFPTPELVTSFDVLTDALQAVDFTGFGMELENGREVIVSERPEYFYNNKFEVARFENPESVEIDVASEYIFNEVEIGFKKWESETSAGRDEIAGKIGYLTPIRTAENKISLLSDYIGSGYILEKTRRKKYVESSKEDFRHDKDVFIVKTNPAGVSGDLISFADFETVFAEPAYFISSLKKGDKIGISEAGDNDGVYTVASIKTGNFSGLKTRIRIEEAFPSGSGSGGKITVFNAFAAERNENFEILEGVVSPESVYNVDLAPAYNFARAGSWINSGLYFKKGSEKYKFLPGEGNVTFESKRSSSAPCAVGDPERARLRHNQNRTISSVDRAGRLFIPEIISFKSGVSDEQTDALLRSYNPDETIPIEERYGFISVYTDRGYIDGFLLESRINEKENKVKFTLLRAITSQNETQEYNSQEYNSQEYN